MKDLIYNDQISRIRDFTVLGSKLAVLKSLRDYFGLTKSLQELAQIIDKLRVMEKTGALSSKDIDDSIFNAVLNTIRTQKEQYKIFGGIYDSEYESIDYTDEQNDAEVWYSSLPKEHQAFVDILMYRMIPTAE